MTNYFLSEVTAKNLWKMPLTITLGSISQEQFKRGPRNSMHLSGTIGLTTQPDLTLLAAFGWLHNCVQSKMGLAGKESNNLATV